MIFVTSNWFQLSNQLGDFCLFQILTSNEDNRTIGFNTCIYCSQFIIIGGDYTINVETKVNFIKKIMKVVSTKKVEWLN